MDDLSRLGKRETGFRKIFQLLSRKRRFRKQLVMVETGCLRAMDWEGDGCSTLLFHDFATRTGSRFISIDIEPAHCRLARRHCPGTQVLCGDSVATLYRLRRDLKRIDFLYLDSYDVDWNNPHPSALHHFKELCAAAPMLESGALIFIDDHREGSGKALYVKDYLHSIRAKPVFEDYQIGFMMR